MTVSLDLFRKMELFTHRFNGMRTESLLFKGGYDDLYQTPQSVSTFDREFDDYLAEWGAFKEQVGDLSSKPKFAQVAMQAALSEHEEELSLFVKDHLKRSAALKPRLALNQRVVAVADCVTDLGTWMHAGKKASTLMIKKEIAQLKETSLSPAQLIALVEAEQGLEHTIQTVIKELLDAILSNDPSSVKRVLEKMPQDIEDSIYRRVWELAGEPEEIEYGRTHACDDMGRLSKAISLLSGTRKPFSRVLRELHQFAQKGQKNHEEFAKLMEQLSEEDQGKIYERIWRLSGEPVGDPHWGKNHALDNLDTLKEAVTWLRKPFIKKVGFSKTIAS